MYNCEKQIPSGTSLRACTFVPNVQWGGHNRPSGSRCRRFGRDPCSVSRVAKALKLFWPWAHSSQIPGFPQHPRGSFFCIPYIRARTHDLDANRAFMIVVEGTRFFPSPLAKRTTVRPCRPHQQSSPLAAAAAAAACNSMRVWLLM